MRINKKIVKKTRIDDPQLVKDEVLYWLSRPSQERIAVVDYLRVLNYGNTARLQRVARVIQRSQS